MTKEKYISKKESANQPPVSSGSWWKNTVDSVTDILSDRSQNVDAVLLGIIIALVVGGIIMMYSASFAYAYYNENGDSDYFFRHQLIYAVIGMVLMFGVSLYPAEKLKKYNLLVLGISTILLIIVLFLPEISYVHRWIDLGFHLPALGDNQVRRHSLRRNVGRFTCRQNAHRKMGRAALCCSTGHQCCSAAS